eukprot:8853297-Ditylum_brightwellii.AAC.1
MHGQVHWKQILQNNTTESTKDILNDFMLIDENDLKGAKLKCSPNKATAAKICTLPCGNPLLAQSRQQCRHTLTTTRLMVQPFCTTFSG